jgi:AraC-like DNA-binding protein
MDFVFSTENFAPDKRYAAWRDAICDVYVNVEVQATDPDRYRGFIKETKFGDVVLTDILVSQQTIRRQKQHLARLDKDCYYIQLSHFGKTDVVQHGNVVTSTPACGAIFCATETYELQCRGDVRSFYLELPRAAFSQRFAAGKAPLVAALNTTRGLGRIATEFCATLAAESPHLAAHRRAGIGDSLMDLLAQALQAATEDEPLEDSTIKAARLRTIQNWIMAHLGESDLTLERIAAANGVSLRYLHLLFRTGESTASEWIQNARLQRAHDRLARGEGRSITDVAYDVGFNSSSHFSTQFRRRYGVSPREVVKAFTR